MTQQSGQPYAIAHSATTLTILSILSPIAGLVVELTLAWRFGASETVDAFRIASLIILFASQLFFGNLLPHVVVPLFSEYRAKGAEQDGWRLAFSLAGLLGAISAIFMVYSWVRPDILVDLLGPGLSGIGRTDALLFVRYFSIAFVLMVWSGVMSGTLSVYRIFWPLPATQLLSNLLIVTSVIAVGRTWGGGSIVLGVLTGSTVMLGVHLYLLRRIALASHIHLLTSLKFGPWVGVRRAMHLAAPLLVMIVVGLWGTIVSNRVLSEMAPGTLANYGYAWKLLALLGILPASLATVVFPALSEAQAMNDRIKFSRLVARAFRMTLLLTFPVTALLFSLRQPIVSFMFERGAMSSAAISDIGSLFGIMLVGAPGISLMVALNKVSFAMHNTRIPAIAMVILVVIVVLFVPYFGGIAGAAGVAWINNIAVWTSTLGLLAYLVWRQRVMGAEETMRFFAQQILLSAGVLVTAMLTQSLFRLYWQEEGLSALIEVIIVTLTCMYVTYILSRKLAISESSELLNYIKWHCTRIFSLLQQNK